MRVCKSKSSHEAGAKNLNVCGFSSIKKNAVFSPHPCDIILSLSPLPLLPKLNWAVSERIKIHNMQQFSPPQRLHRGGGGEMWVGKHTCTGLYYCTALFPLPRIFHFWRNGEFSLPKEVFPLGPPPCINFGLFQIPQGWYFYRQSKCHSYKIDIWYISFSLLHIRHGKY